MTPSDVLANFSDDLSAPSGRHRFFRFFPARESTARSAPSNGQQGQSPRANASPAAGTTCSSIRLFLRHHVPFRGPRFRLGLLLLAFAIVAVLPGPPNLADELEETATVAEDLRPCLILVTLDGLRWEEVFRGADERFMNREAGGVRDVDALKSQFWDEDPEVRRRKLLPFLWTELVPQGQLWGNQDMDCQVRVTNGRYFSYPGYHELLAGHADPRIDSNAKRHNPNITVLEWIHRREGFGGSVQAFCSWDVFPYILNSPRSGIPVNAGWEPLPDLGDNSLAPMLNMVADNLPRIWEGVRYDYFTFQGALQALKNDRPRVLYVGLGETDDWAHEGRYDLYLESARRNDQYLRELWHFAQNDPYYAGRTSLLIATDHGRGDTPSGWKSHGANIPGSESIWIACLGPDVPPLGVRAKLEATQSQVAATGALMLGLDYGAAVAEAAPPLNLK